MPIVTVETWEGRTVEQKRRLVEALTDAMVEHFQSTRERTYVVIHDVPKQNWGRGGVLSVDDEAPAESKK